MADPERLFKVMLLARGLLCRKCGVVGCCGSAVAAAVIIHMDDSEVAIQEAAASVLEALAAKKPAAVREEVAKVRGTGRRKLHPTPSTCLSKRPAPCCRCSSNTPALPSFPSPQWLQWLSHDGIQWPRVARLLLSHTLTTHGPSPASGHHAGAKLVRDTHHQVDATIQT